MVRASESDALSRHRSVAFAGVALRPVLSLLLWGAAVIAFSGHARGLEDCVLIDDDIGRLACFDRLVETQGASVRAPCAPADREPETGSASGKEIHGADDVLGHVAGSISARIDRVATTPLGHHVVTLSNGQIWMENEPGRRPIRPGQHVVVRKHRWHYEMELAGQPNVAVHRLE